MQLWVFVYKPLFKHLFLVPLWYISRSGIWGFILLCLVFWGTINLFFTPAAPIYESSNFSVSSPNICFVEDSHHIGYNVVSHLFWFECMLWCLILCDPMSRSLPGSSVHGILARILVSVAISCSMFWFAFP